MTGLRDYEALGRVARYRTGPEVQCRSLSEAAKRVLVVLRDPQEYVVPYPASGVGVAVGRRLADRLADRWVPITFAHYEAGQGGGEALAVLAELDARGVRVEWSVDSALGARIRLA